MTLIKLYRASIHVLIFIAGSRLLAAAQMDRSEALTLLLAACICVALLFHWRRAPVSFGRDPQLAAQILMHGLAVLGAVLAAQALGSFMAMWNAVATTVVVSGVAAVLLLITHVRLGASVLFRYGAMALGSVALMGTVAVVLLAWGTISSGAAH